MTATGYVVLGLAPARAGWFTEVARWATGGLVPVELHTCVSIDEVRARLAGGRAYSALLVDATATGVDRDLFDEVRAAGAAVVIVDDGTTRRDWRAVGADAVLAVPFDATVLLAALADAAPRIGSDGEVRLLSTDGPAPPGWQGTLVAVCGAGGSGTSVAAQALAHGLGQRLGTRGEVVLADLALHADQAMLHAADDVLPGVQELLDAVRRGEVGRAELDALLFSGPRHPYALLLGLRRHRDWTILRPRAVAEAITALRRHHTFVVADVDADVEGERACGSLDVEERNLLARTATAEAAVVVVTAHAGVQGVHRLVRVLAGLVDHGVTPDRLLPVVMRSPRTARARAEITRAVADLLTPALPGDTPAPPAPLHLPTVRTLDRDLWDGTGPPAALRRPLTEAVLALLDRVAPVAGSAADEGVPVRPGSLGSWTAEEAVG